LTFDDGILDALTQAAPTLQANGLTGTDYIIANCVGLIGKNNGCPADTDVDYMTWDQITQLKNTYGWEIGGHTVTHPMLATDNLTDAQLTQEIAGGKQTMVSHGFNPTTFATPYGDYDNRVLAEIAKSYAAHRGFWDVSPNAWPYNDYIINNMQVQYGVSVASVEAAIDQAIANKTWLVLTFHDIEPTPSTNPDDYQYATADLATIAAYVKAKQDAGQIKSVKMQDGLVTSTTNLMPNPDLASGLASGWVTDTPANVVADSANHGSYPEPQHAVSLTAGSTGNAHLFSPTVSVSSTKTYMLQSFLNLTARTSGELGYYIDEYNSNGDWISGQWKLAETAPTVTDVMLTYKPSSAQVSQARLQVYVTPGSGIQAYVDNFRWFPMEAVDSPPPTTQNIMPNSTFETGMSDGWHTNNTTAFIADNAGHGAPADPTGSIKLASTTTNASLFAPLVGVTPAISYDVSAYLNIQTLANNELAFYVDEYDTNGSWISGQYKTAKRDTGIQVIDFAYVPTSSTVSKAGLQVILVANSGITGYLDDVKFLAPAGSSPPPPDNLVTNGAFDDGIADGWHTDDPATITVDNTGHGSPANAQNAIKLVASTQNQHLFSPLVTVSAGTSYTISGYLDLQQITSGEVGFYIDEYDLAGNWTSGHYISGISIISAGDFNFAYTPASSNVATASLQIIVMGNSGIQGYIDDIRWLKN
jgi:peptidoglycan/xylan/chitin deacetylase (PgdA/CDA1 family)